MSHRAVKCHDFGIDIAREVLFFSRNVIHVLAAIGSSFQRLLSNHSVILYICICIVTDLLYMSRWWFIIHVF